MKQQVAQINKFILKQKKKQTLKKVICCLSSGAKLEKKVMLILHDLIT